MWTHTCIINQLLLLHAEWKNYRRSVTLVPIVGTNHAKTSQNAINNISGGEKQIDQCRTWKAVLTLCRLLENRWIEKSFLKHRPPAEGHLDKWLGNGIVKMSSCLWENKSTNLLTCGERPLRGRIKNGCHQRSEPILKRKLKKQAMNWKTISLVEPDICKRMTEFWQEIILDY